ncbi:testicular acid phosphatase homolog [Toxorhynchites rutilus septentrionalis]|uniref:testicular acid phosphatase homolog n=1 Tax=Toxorhynchites rutilus septentrionalis TaxID=329112 RepID=UPI002479C5B2|nr:testicular acid phosphatase homolog [Toxorhynchites rutilus septentrionalis]
MWRQIAFAIVLVQLTYLVATLGINGPAKRPGDKLLFAHVIYRHGNRTPVGTYPTDPWKDVSNWQTGRGELTNVGKQTQLLLGRWLRKRYNSLISDFYSTEDVYVQSSEYDRTIMSALANLAGFYPPKGKDIWDKTIDWQPIPVHQIPRSLDNTIASSKPCARYDEELKRYLHREPFRSYNRSIASVYEYLSKHTNMTVDNYTSLVTIYDVLHIQHLSKLKLPEWTRTVYPEPLTCISATFYRLPTSTILMKRLRGGPLLKEILNRFQQKINKTLQPDRSLWIYSGHDITILSLLDGLGVLKTHVPSFAACVMIELSTAVDGKPFVSLFYKNSDAEPETMVIPNCGTRCPLQKFGELYKHLISENWEKECAL